MSWAGHGMAMGTEWTVLGQRVFVYNSIILDSIYTQRIAHDIFN